MADTAGDENVRYSSKLAETVKAQLKAIGVDGDFSGVCRGLSGMVALNVLNNSLSPFMQQIIEIASSTKLNLLDTDVATKDIINGIALFMYPGAFIPHIGGKDSKLSQRHIREIHTKLSEIGNSVIRENAEPLDLILFRYKKYTVNELKIYLNTISNIIREKNLQNLPIILGNGEHSIAITYHLEDAQSRQAWQVVDSDNLSLWRNGERRYDIHQVGQMIAESFIDPALLQAQPTVMTITTEIYAPQSYMHTHGLSPLKLFEQFTKPEDAKMLFDCLHSCTGDTIKKLIQVGIDINARSPSDSTLLHSYASIGNKTVVEALIQANIKIDAQDTSLLGDVISNLMPWNKESALATYNNYMQIAEILIRAGANTTALRESVASAQRCSEDPTWAAILTDLEKLNAVAIATPQIMPLPPASMQITPMFQSTIQQATVTQAGKISGKPQPK